MNSHTPEEIARAYATLDHIDANPDSHDQTWWFKTNKCGTTACFAGLTALLAGAGFYEVPSLIDSYDSVWHTRVITPEGKSMYVRDYAQQLLGLSDSTAHRIFSGLNSREALHRMVRFEFGPRSTQNTEESNA